MPKIKDSGLAPTLMSDSQATALGLKVYSAGIAYNGPTSPSVTTSNDDLVPAATFTPYQTQSGSWKLKGNIPAHPLTQFLINLGSGPNAPVYSIKTQPDDKVLVGGSFTSFNGVIRGRLVRLNVDGTVDTPFYTNLGGGFNSVVLAVAVQPDGKILVGGSFVNYGGVSGRNYLVRLNADGTLDTAFCTNAVDGGKFNSTVRAITLQTDGKVLIGGDFNNYGGVSGRNILVRVGSDGVLDAAFSTSLLSKFSILDGGYTYVDYDDFVEDYEVYDDNVQSSYYNYGPIHYPPWNAFVFYHSYPVYVNFGQSVNTVKVTAQGQILVGGTFVFSTTGLRAVSYIALNTDGTASSTMQRLTLFRDGGGGVVNGASVSAIEISASGNIYVGGYFNGGNIFALTSAGAASSVATFGVVYSLTALTDGRVLVDHNGSASGPSAILSSGVLDATFSPGLAGRIYSASQKSGFILLGGDKVFKIRLNGAALITTDYTETISGVAFDASAAQAVTVSPGSAVASSAQTIANSGAIRFLSASSISSVACSFDVALASKPTWSY